VLNNGIKNRFQGSSCCNEYRKTTNAHEGVRKLHLNGNPITDWNEICRLGRVFPKLEALVLAECPLRFVIFVLKKKTKK
jgi:hypothetical protein